MIVQDTIPLAPAATADFGHDRGWWDSESARVGSDWPTVVDTALDLLAAGGILEPEPDDTMTSWNAPSWRDAAVDYHRDRPSTIEIEPKRLTRLRRLLADDVSLGRASHELRGNPPTPAVTVEGLMLALRRGVAALAKPDTQRRLAVLDKDQLEAVCLRVQAFEPRIAPAWSAEDADLLISSWRKFHGHR